MSINNCVFSGNIMRDPEFITTQSGSFVCKFTVNQTKKYKDTKTYIYFNCISFGKQAEIINKYFHSGDGIQVIAQYEPNVFQDKETGKNKSIPQFRVVEFSFSEKSFPKYDNGNNNNSNSHNNNNRQSYEKQKNMMNEYQKQQGSSNINNDVDGGFDESNKNDSNNQEDDIPF